MFELRFHKLPLLRPKCQTTLEVSNTQADIPFSLTIINLQSCSIVFWIVIVSSNVETASTTFMPPTY